MVRPKAPASPGPGANNSWTQDDIRYVSIGASSAFAMPEIYSNTIAQEWQNLSAYNAKNYSLPIAFSGVLTQHQACIDQPSDPTCTNGTDTPTAAWSNLWTAINANSDTADQSIYQSSDMTWNNNPSQLP